MPVVSVTVTLEALLKDALSEAQARGALPAFEAQDVALERPADPNHGEWSSSLALRSAKAAKLAPRKIAEALVDAMPSDPALERVEIAGPGFINFYLTPAAKNRIFAQAREQDASFGSSDVGGGQSIQVEFVSANPVGPMHVGHGRWAALGDSLCRVLAHTNYVVEPEFYVNDHGSQMDVFGASIAERYLQLVELIRQGSSPAKARAALLADREAFVEEEAEDESEREDGDEDNDRSSSHPFMDAFIAKLGGNAYGGDYVIDLALRFYETDGDGWVDQPAKERELEFRERGYQQMLEEMRATCHAVRCDFSVWFSERSLYTKDESGSFEVERAFNALDEMGYLYKADGALWFRSTALGDDKDRVLVKENGEYTYFASDVAYHWNKFQRVDHVIDIWGADHHGYIARVRAACDALGYEGRFEVLLGQFVNLLRDGVPVRMSKRKGTMITFKELIDEVGADAARYTLMSRSSNQPIDFDIEKVKRQSADNPVYYVQYAHARICSVLRRAAAQAEGLSEVPQIDAAQAAQALNLSAVDYSLLTESSEAALARQLESFEELVASCARDRAPFRITHYLQDLASAFHGFYTECPILSRPESPVAEELSRARLGACDAVRIALEVGLGLIGVSAPQSM